MKVFLNSILFISLIFITSCNSEENTDKFENIVIDNTNYSNQNKEILSAEFGFYHNEAIILYLAELDRLDRKVPDQEISNAIKEMAGLMAEKYPSVFGDVDVDELLDYFNEFTYIKDYGYDKLKDNLLLNFSNSEINSEIFLQFLNEVCVDETITYKGIIEKINLESDYSDEFLVFESILDSSYSLWSSSPGYQGSFNRCGRGGIIVDAGIGALLWFTGPIGILGGAAGSLIYMDNCENGNP